MSIGISCAPISKIDKFFSQIIFNVSIDKLDEVKIFLELFIIQQSLWREHFKTNGLRSGIQNPLKHLRRNLFGKK